MAQSLDSVIQTTPLSIEAVICLDTCAILDILRNPIRETVTVDQLEATLYLLRAIEEKRILPIVSETVEIEFSQHLSNVVRDTDEGVRSLLETSPSQSEKLLRLSRLIGIDTTDSTFIRAQYTGRLTRVAEKWLSASTVIHESDGVKELAQQRVTNQRKPASKISEADSDCLILENYLAFVRKLRAQPQFDKVTVVFISSNINDFCKLPVVGLQPGVLHDDIAPDFQSLDIRYARFMREARIQLSPQ